MSPATFLESDTWVPTTAGGTANYIDVRSFQPYAVHAPSALPHGPGRHQVFWLASSADAVTVVMVQDVRIAESVRNMISARAQTEEAIRFLKDRLSAIPQVREAFVRDIPGGLDLWAVVDKPFYEGEGATIRELHEAERRFRLLDFDFRILRYSQARHVRPRTEDTSLVSR